MKTIKLLTAIVLATSMMIMSAFATEFVPSIEQKDSPKLNDYTVEEINASCCTVLIIPYGHINFEDFIDEEHVRIEYATSKEMEEEIKESLKNAAEELKGKLINNLVPGFEEAWAKATGGAPLENTVVSELFEIVMICSDTQEFNTDDKLTVSFTVDGLGADDAFIIVHKPTGSDEWIIEEHEIDENGVITISPDKLSPFAIIKDNGNSPVVDPDAPDSPQTGVEESGYLAIAGMIFVALMASCAVVCIRKIKKTSAQ